MLASCRLQMLSSVDSKTEVLSFVLCTSYVCWWKKVLIMSQWGILNAIRNWQHSEFELLFKIKTKQNKTNKQQIKPNLS